TRAEGLGVRVHVPDGLDPTLVRLCAERVLRRGTQQVGIEVTVTSEIPVSRGLKSSSAVANAVVLACARALGAPLEPLRIIGIGADAACDAGVTLTRRVDETPAIRARAAGAKAAGITGTGPSILALAQATHVDAVRRAMDDGSSEVRVVRLNTIESREVVA